MALRFRYAPWRKLFQHLLDYDGDAWTDDVLLPWIEANPRPVADLHRIGQATAMNIPIPNDHDNYTPLQALYVLTRVIDVLIAPHQRAPGEEVPEREPGPWPGRIPDPGAYRSFCACLGSVQVAE